MKRKVTGDVWWVEQDQQAFIIQLPQVTDDSVAGLDRLVGSI